MLVYSLLLMGAATVLMGLLPSYASIGIWAPVLLVLLRLAQGFGVGGEWGGAALMAVEHAPDHRRGFYGAWPQVGVPVGLVLGTGSYALLSATLTDEPFLEWGWRVPFLASALLIAVGMWIRLTVAESPIFQQTLDAKSAAKMPVLEALKTYPKEIALAAGSFLATHATFYVGSVWLISYATTELEYNRTTILNANAALSLSDIPMMLALGLLSDYIGRRKLFLTGMAVLALFTVPYFMLVSTGNIWLFMLGGLIVQACRCAVYGPMSAYFAEQFSTRMRYSGSSLAYQFAAILGGMAPLICTALVAATGSVYSVAAFVIVIAMVSFACSYLMTETLRTGLRDDEPTHPAAPRARRPTGGQPLPDVKNGQLVEVPEATILLGRISVQVLKTRMREGETFGHIHSSADDLDVCARFTFAGCFQCGIELAQRLDAGGEPVRASERVRQICITPFCEIVVGPVWI